MSAVALCNGTASNRRRIDELVASLSPVNQEFVDEALVESDTERVLGYLSTFEASWRPEH